MGIESYMEGNHLDGKAKKGDLGCILGKFSEFAFGISDRVCAAKDFIGRFLCKYKNISVIHLIYRPSTPRIFGWNIS